MNIEKLSKLYINKVEKQMGVMYKTMLGEEFTEEQVSSVVDYVLSLGVAAAFEDSVKSLFNEEELIEMTVYQDKYNTKAEALEVLMQGKLETLMGGLDEDKLGELLGL